MAASEDTFIPIQDPPTINIATAPLDQSFNSGSNWESVDRILPSASADVIRAGFTGNATSSDIDTGRTEIDDSSDSSAEFDNTTSNDIDRVAPDQSETSAPIYRQIITVSTNGPTDTIQRVGYCLINTSDTVIRANPAEFEWYDSGDTGRVVTNDVERNCGFNDDDPTAVATPDAGSERAVISIVYNVASDEFTLENSGNALHEVVSTSADASWDEQELTLEFKFRASHGLLKQVSGWAVRAAAQDQPGEVTNGAPGETTFDPQLSQIYWGMNQHMEGEVNSSVIDNRSQWKYASVGYYGAIVSERDSVAFGTLEKDQSRTITEITTGRYIANAISEIWMEALDFKSQGAGNVELSYVDSGSPGDNEVSYECSLEPGSGDPGTLGANAQYLGNTPVELTDSLPFTTFDTDPEQELEINSEGMSCRLMYGGGASDASEVFQNEVIVSIKDAGTAVPPFNQ